MGDLEAFGDTRPGLVTENLDQEFRTVRARLLALENLSPKNAYRRKVNDGHHHYQTVEGMDDGVSKGFGYQLNARNGLALTRGTWPFNRQLILDIVSLAGAVCYDHVVATCWDGTNGETVKGLGGCDVRIWTSIADATAGAVTNDVIFICPGLYDDKPVIDGKRLVIIGAGRSILQLTGSFGPTIVSPSSSGDVFTFDNDGFQGSTLRGLLIKTHAGGGDGVQVDATVTSLPVELCDLTIDVGGTGANAIDCNTHSSKIHHIQAISGHIKAVGGNYTQVHNCRIDGANLILGGLEGYEAFDNMTISGGIVLQAPTVGGNIHDNWIRGNTGLTTTAGQCRFISLRNNKYHLPTVAAIDLSNVTTSGEGWSIQNEKIEAVGGVKCIVGSATISESLIMGNHAVTVGGGAVDLYDIADFGGANVAFAHNYEDGQPVSEESPHSDAEPRSGDLGILYDNGSLSVGWTAFITREDNVINSVSAGTLNTTDDDTSYYEVVGTTVSMNTTGYTLGSIPLGKVVASSGDIDSITEETAVLDQQSGLWDADGDTGVEVEESADEDIVRVKTASVERVNVDGTDMSLTVPIDMGDNVINNLADPVLGGDAVNLDTLLESLSVSLQYYFGAASVMSPTFSAGENHVAEAVVGTPQELLTIIQVASAADTPDPFTINAGTIISVHFDAKVLATAGKKPTFVYVQLGYVDADGSSNFVQIGADSDPGVDALTTTQTMQEQHVHVAADTTIPAGKRLKVKWWATTTGALPDPTIWVYYGAVGDHINIPVSAGILGNFLRRDGTTELTGDWEPGNLRIIGNWLHTEKVLSFSIGDASYGQLLLGGDPVISFDSAGAEFDYIQYERATNTWMFRKNSGLVFSIDPSGISLPGNRELRFYDNGNYVGFEAPALAADQIWVLPDADGAAGTVLATAGDGTLTWGSSPTSILTTRGDLIRRGAAAPERVALGADGQVFKSDGTDAVWEDDEAGIEFMIDGGGSEIALGIAGWLAAPFACTLKAVRLLADQTGSIKVDIWKDTYANYPPTNADTITGANEPEIAAGVKDEDTGLAAWTTAVAKGDILYYNVDTIDTIEKCLVVLEVDKT